MGKENLSVSKNNIFHTFVEVTTKSFIGLKWIVFFICLVLNGGFVHVNAVNPVIRFTKMPKDLSSPT